MISRIFISLFFSLLIFFLFNQCANTKNPTGGPRDTIPPSLIYSNPNNFSTNFKGNEIEFEFNEYIEVDQLTNNLIITPRVQSEFKSRYNKNRFTLEFEEDNPFSDSTTYILNFQETIKDINERNPWDSSKFVFSTGNYLDSLSISGTVKDLMTDNPAKEAVVTLYFVDDTLDVFTDKPPYFSNVDEEGIFSITNLKPAAYNIYAFNDENNNLTIDSDSEPYGFINQSIQLDSSINNVNIDLYPLNLNKIRLFTAQSIRNNFDISFNKSLDSYTLSPQDTTIKYFSNLVENKTKIRIYDSNLNLDSIRTKLRVTDSIAQTLDTLLYVKFEESEAPKVDFSQSFKPDNNSGISTDFSAEAKFNKPIISINYDSLYIKYDSITLQYLNANHISFNKRNDQVNINIELWADSIRYQEETAQPIQFYAGIGTFISVEQDSNQTIKRQYSLFDPTTVGIIKGTIQSEIDSFTIQLLDQQYKVLRSIENQHEYAFNNVQPGTYLIRILFDENMNGSWDPGNIFNNQTPEPVVFFKNPDTEDKIILKANWEMTDINIQYP